MRIRVNPWRAGIFIGLTGLWLLWHVVPQHLCVQTIDLRLPRLEPVHLIVAWAMVCISVVGLARLFRRGD